MEFHPKMQGTLLIYTDFAIAKVINSILNLRLFDSVLLFSFCKSDTLDPALVKGKIVVCTLEIILDPRNEKARTVKQAGGAGIILVDPLATDIAFQFEIPGTLISIQEAEKLQAYMVSQK